MKVDKIERKKKKFKFTSIEGTETSKICLFCDVQKNSKGQILAVNIILLNFTKKTT